MPEAPDLLSSTEEPPAPPAGLTERAAEFWTEVVSRYQLRVDDLAVLHLAARQLGLADHLAEQMAGQPLTVKGSQGQQVIHPVLGELRQARALLASLLRQLKLPDDLADDAPKVESPTTRRARAAANSRWSRERAQGGPRG